MSPKTKKWVKFTLRWGIAVLGIFYVIRNLSLHDQVMVQRPSDGWPVMVRLAAPGGEQDETYQVYWPFDGDETSIRTISRYELLKRADRDRVKITLPDGQVRTMELHGLRVSPGDESTWPLVVAERRHLYDRYWGKPSPVRVVMPDDVAGEWRVTVPYPLVELGLISMVRTADPLYLWAAIGIFPLTFLITSVRWHDLLKALDIFMGLPRAFVINMVGAFYNTFMPGSTGGDLLKAYYAAKQAPLQRTRAVMSVVVDRAIGLLALIMMGGAIAAYQYLKIGDVHDPTAQACLQVAIASGAVLGAVVLGLSIFYTPILCRWTGLSFLLRRLPMQRQVNKAIDAMNVYRKRPVLVAWTLLISFPVHATVVTSAMLAGMALGLPLELPYYWVVVPVVVLTGAIPISPQGAGVMEFFAILLTKREGMTVGQAFALTMSIRLVQILWNLVGGIFVFRGGYHAPTQKEAESLEDSNEPVQEGR